MSRKEIITIAGFLVAVLTLLFGDNIYQQLTGHSFYNPMGVDSKPTTIVATPIVTMWPTSTPTPTATPKPVSLGKIRIPGNVEEGVRFTANQDGQYIFTYVSGAYSPWPDAQPAEPKWRTSVSVYRNRPIEWVQRPYNLGDDKSIIYKEPRNSDGFIGNYDVTTQSEAISIARAARSLRFDLRAGDYLIFVVSDDQGWYNNPAPNIGEVVFEISFIPR
jgi:hypothetical protein